MKQHVIADSDLLSDLAKAQAAEGCHAGPWLLPQLFKSPILVPVTVRKEMMDPSPTNVAPCSFASNLPEGYKEIPDPLVVDLSMAYKFRVKNDHDKGDVHILTLVEKWLSQNDEVLVLSNDNTFASRLEKRFPDNQNLSIKTLADVLCEGAEKDLIPDAGKELIAMRDAGFSKPNEEVLEMVKEFQRVYVDRHREQRLEQGKLTTQQPNAPSEIQDQTHVANQLSRSKDHDIER